MTWRSRRGSTAQPSVGTTTWPVYLVTVTSAGGQIEVTVEVTGEIMPGVVSMPHGWGHGKPGTRMAIANESPGVNTNILSPPTFIDKPSGNGALNGIPVTVTAVAT
jgi:anaerobic selenocysteine-containing dehydrogenase